MNVPSVLRSCGALAVGGRATSGGRGLVALLAGLRHMSTGAQTNRQCLLKERPVEMPDASTWDIRDSPIPKPNDGEVLVKIKYASLDPAMRGWLREGKSYIPPVGIGEVMRALTIGEVVASNNAQYAVGDTVVGQGGIQQYHVTGGKELRKVDPKVLPMPTYIGGLGMPGMTAYFGLLHVGQPKEGETILVSAAAGAVGAIVGQIGKIKGCRVVGIAGGSAKCKYITEELGFDAAIDYKTDNIYKALKEKCPKGIDVYFDNVGGEILDAALSRLNRGARIPLCGAISQYNKQVPAGPRNYLSLLVNRARMEGFVVFDYAKEYKTAANEMIGWYGQGKLKFKEHVVEGGVDKFPSALNMLFTGDNFGKLVLKMD
eukprot:comp25601_c0_seq1/m.47010 comp25601_c0_seq1/g.47010  ORF comp25601_c0_seq1/g.47010 comp25601_c0_seq1/m.47010 type:complete len:373 (-) comp25601_c0_seq1:33-1151(-)